VNSIAIHGSEAVVRVGRYGPYLERGEERANIPADLAPDELTAEKAEELLAQPDNRPLGAHPETGNEIVVRTGRYGPYVTEVLPDGAEGKPRTASLFASMSPETVGLDDALRLLTLPRIIGEIDGEEVTAQNGRYGPYVKRGTDSRSLESEEQLFTITLEDARALLAQPPRRRGRGAARGPLRELGEDPSSGKKIVVKDGRFGPYVTDGETNASLRRGDTVEGVTPERASELLAERRAKSA
jgi:DNA topoisomerase-1